ncbi:hypothetical protein CS8_002190 [Cupriavidus sp. 8B]
MEKDGVSTQALRRLSETTIRIEPADSIDDEEWDSFLWGLWACQLLPRSKRLNKEISQEYFNATGGFIGHLVPLHALAQKLAIVAGRETITVEDIKEAASKRPLAPGMKRMIRAFVEKDASKLVGFSDVDNDYYIEKWGHAYREAAQYAPSKGFVATQVDPEYVRRQARLRAERSLTGESEKSRRTSNVEKDHHLSELRKTAAAAGGKKN